MIRFEAKRLLVLSIGCVLAMAGAAVQGQEGNDKVVNSQPNRGPNDEIIVHEVRSEYQSGVTQVRVVTPSKLDASTSYPVLYILPVEAGRESRYGDGLLEARRHDLPNKWKLICVQPTFSHLPWYADHPTDAAIRQESYFLKVVLPLVEREYPTRPGRAGRWLVGFSKSGWGAYSLLLRHPDQFDRAAAWDAPLMKDQPNQFGMGEIFGTATNFAHYQLTTLAARQAATLGTSPRLVLTGYGNFHEQHVAFHDRMVELNVPHVYRDGPKLKHVWESGWLPEAVELLARLAP